MGVFARKSVAYYSRVDDLIECTRPDIVIVIVHLST